ncbi:MAG: class I tRNA ligase family protein, partial [Methanobacterium sp.]|nr:class I tRNA ligase family protein [Methanobacterium sp.]
GVKSDTEVKSIKSSFKPLDKWILSGLNQLVGEVTQAMEDYNFAHARNRIQAYIWHDFCDDYIEAVKYRLYTDDEGESKQAALYTLNTVIKTCLRLMAPFTPHFTEEIHYYLEGYGSDEGVLNQDNGEKLDKIINENVFRSIHQERWPEVVEDLVDPEADKTGQLGVEVIGELRRFKASRKMPLNTPLKGTTIYSSSPKKYKQLLTLQDDIKGTMRIEELMVSEGKPDVREIVVEVTPRMDKIGPEFKGQAPVIVKYLQSREPQEIASSLEENGSIDIEGSLITAEHINTSKELVGRTGEKVELLLLDEMDLVMELVI